MKCPHCQHDLSPELIAAAPHSDGYFLCPDCLGVLHLDGGELRPVDFRELNREAEAAVNKHMRIQTVLRSQLRRR